MRSRAATPRRGSEPVGLDRATCERARKKLDRRFDGRFVVAVRGAGVYCRPICPKAASGEADYHVSSAAAAAAGLRPCARCRPEAAPDTPAREGAGRATLARALRLIDAGALDRGDPRSLAERLGVPEPELHATFERHLGAAPVAVAHTRRVHFARRLIADNDLPLARVARATGFGSAQRFAAAYLRAVGSAPPKPRSRAQRGAPIEVRLPYRPPFDFAGILGFLAPRAIPGVECVEGARYRRSIATGQGVDGSACAVVEVEDRPDTGELLARVWLGDASDDALGGIAAGIRRVFDLAADSERIDACLGGDALLAPLVRKRPGVRVPGAIDGFELAVRAVLGQQVSVAAATTLSGRLVERLGEPFAAAAAGISRVFPHPERVRDADLGGLGITGGRARTLRGLAAAVAAHELRFDVALEPSAIVGALRALPGIGEWTAQYVAMRAFGEPDAFPHGDLALLRAVEPAITSARALSLRSERWRPYRAYAAMHLWRRAASVNR